MRTRSQGPPVSPNIERDANPFPNPEQIARDQADAVRLASLAAQGEVGLVNGVNTHNVGVEQGEIPPVSIQHQVVYGIHQETSENSLENVDQGEATEQKSVTGEIPPNQTNEREEEGAVGGVIQMQESPHNPTKTEEVSREENTVTPADIAQDIVDGQQFMDDNLSDVMRNSAITSNLSSLLNFTTTTAQKTDRPATMDWILPDGLNTKLESVTDKEIADFPAPGTNNGAMIMDIPNIEPYFNTKRFLVDLHTGDMFAATRGSWYRLEVGCRKIGFVTENLATLLEHAGSRLEKQLRPIDKDQTTVLRLDSTKAKAPPIPFIPNAYNYQAHTEAMSPTARKNYIKDRTQVAETYITEYNNTRLWKLEDIIPPENLNQRLQIVFGRVDAARRAIDYALEKDNEVRRRTNLRYLEAPTRFPTPDTMQAHEPIRWIAWIQEETQKLIEAINEEIKMLNDEDDPFSTAGQQIQRKTGEIPPVETLATPLIPEKVNNPLPQRTKPQSEKGTGEIPPVNTQNPIQGKPPTHNTKPAKRQINYDNMTQPQEQQSHSWGHDSPYLHLPREKNRTQMEQFSLNGTPEIKICYRCGYEGHIKRYCNNHVYCDYCRTYTHHTSVCRSYQRYTQNQPITSSRRNSPAAQVEKTKYDGIDKEQQQSKKTPNKEEGLSEITRKHLVQIINSMIPGSYSTLNEDTEATDKGNSMKESQTNTEVEKQVVVNNFYIPNGQGGWKQLETGEIPPVSPATTDAKTGVNYKSATTSNTGNNGVGQAQEDPSINYKQDTKTQDLMAPPQNYNFNHPPPQTTTPRDETTTMLECMRQLQLTLQQHVTTNSRQTDYHMSQNADLFTEMINAQKRRELDPALMAIPTFSGTEPEKCMDWINRIKNVCDQSERPLRQELINKSEPVVQNFIRTLDQTWKDEEIIDEILKYFSDVPTPAHAITKLRALVQGENEPIVTFNQKYRVLLERVERRPVEKIDSYVELEQYLGSIIFPIRKAIRGSIYWKSKHAPNNVGEAMKKAEELYMKHVYTTGGSEEQTDTQITREVTINEVSRNTPNYRFEKDRNTSEIPPVRNTYGKTYSRSYEGNRTGEIPPNTNDDRRQKEGSNTQTTHQLPRGSYTQIMVNPTQLSDKEFVAWMDRLVEARRNRQNNKPRPYSQFRRPYTQRDQDNEPRDLRNKIKPPRELNTEEIMSQMRCEYVDIEEAVEMYNLDVEECRSA